MELVLWRHADAEPGRPDAERKLTARGEAQAARMAQWLAARLPENYAVLASPARRAQQTAHALAADLRTLTELDTGASPQDLLRACRWPHGEGAVVAVGHQPTLGEVAALLLTGKPAQWSVKKGAIAWISLSSSEAQPRLRAWLPPDLA